MLQDICGGGVSIAYYASFSDSLNFILSSSEVLIQNNEAPYGGGIGIRNGALNMIDGIVRDNYAREMGGAIYVENGEVGISGGILEESESVIGGAIYITSGNIVINGGSIKKNNATSGGGIYINSGDVEMFDGEILENKATENGGAVYITGGDFIMPSGTITYNEASNEGGAVYVNDGHITIGLESCFGEDESHAHPVISNNEALNNGGGISIVGGEMKMYCGNLENNKARKNQASNSVNQTGGVFSIWGGNLGIGIIVTDESVFNDYRQETYQVTYHAIYGAVNETMVAYVKANDMLKLPTDVEIGNANFIREDLPLLGWSTNESSTEGYMAVGQSIPIPSNVDLYAVWGIKSFIVYIPDIIEIDNETKTGTITFSASISLFADNESISVKIDDINELVLEDSDVGLSYELLNENDEMIENGDTVATFSNDDINDKNLTLNITDEIYYSGFYKDSLTFLVELHEEI